MEYILLVFVSNFFRVGGFKMVPIQIQLKFIVPHVIRQLVSLSSILVLTSCLQTTELAFQSYKSYLASQQGQDHFLPAEFIELIQDNYSVDLKRVRYHTGIETIGGKVVTIKNRIYFPNSMNFRHPEHIKRMIHELRHVEQYQSNGDIFFQLYQADLMKTSASRIARVANGSTIHLKYSDSSFEQHALKAETEVFKVLQPWCDANACSLPIPLTP